MAAVFQVEPRSEERQRVLRSSLRPLPHGTHPADEDASGHWSRPVVAPGPSSPRHDATSEVPRVPDATDPDATDPGAPEVPVAA